MKKLQIFFLFFIVSLGLKGQNSSVKKAQANFEKAQGYLKSDNYELAAALLKEAVKADPEFKFEKTRCNKKKNEK